MKTYSIYFSPIGGTRKVMDILEQTLGCDEAIDLSKSDTDFRKYHLHEDDLCLVGVPSFGGRVPTVALNRIKQIKGNGAKALLVIVYGNRAYDDTMRELNNELTSYGFRVFAAIGAIAEHSIMHQFGAGRPDDKDRQELKQFANQVKEAFHSDKEDLLLPVPENESYREYPGLPMKPRTNDACILCGICAQSCPVNAIPPEIPSVTQDDICISCMRCIKVCPHDARELDPAMLSAVTEKLRAACTSRKDNELHI